MTAPVRVAYIAGWGRSGSTLLDRMLGRVGGLVSVGEIREVWRHGVIENRLCGCGRPFLDCPFWSEVGDAAYGGWPIDLARRMDAEGRRLDSLAHVDWIRELLGPGSRWSDHARRLAPLYRAVLDVAGARVVVDSSKLPLYAAMLSTSDQLDVRVLHLVRDSRAVANSWRKEVRRPDQVQGDGVMRRYGPVAAGARYVVYNGLTEILHRPGRRTRRLRYEDLVRSPVAVLTDALDAIGAPEPRDLDWLRDGSADLDVSHTVDGNPMRMQKGPMVIKADDAWRSELPRAARAEVTALTLPLLARYGYLQRPAAR